MSDFVDFHVIVKPIEGRDEDELFVAVVDAPVSRNDTAFWQLDRYGRKVREFLLDIGYLADPGDPKNVTLKPSADLKKISVRIFDALFPLHSKGRDLLRQSCTIASLHRCTLRIKLEMHSSVANLPWEAMQPAKTYENVQITQAKKAIVRYLGEIDDRPPANGKGTIIVVRAHPFDVKPIINESLEREAEAIAAHAKRLADEYNFEFIQGPDTLVKLRRCIERIRQNENYVFGIHFLGHGGVDDEGGYLCGENTNSERHLIREDLLADALTDEGGIQWVVLNACCSSFTPSAFPLSSMATHLCLVSNIPTVVGYNRPVQSDDAEQLGARFFARVFNRTKPEAIEEVVASMQVSSSNPGGLTVLSRAIRHQIAFENKNRAFEQKKDDVETTGATPSRPSTANRLRAAEPGQEQIQAHPQDSARPGMLLVKAGSFRKGLSPQQIIQLLQDFRKNGIALEENAAKKALASEAESTVELPSFLIDRTPVTNKLFSEFVRATKYETQAERSHRSANWRAFTDKGSHPVVYISFDDALQYCAWAKKRLPTADEWKKACRGDCGLLYPWGDEFSTLKCNTAESMVGFETTPVEQFAAYPSPYGCLDMVGNVEEWTADSDSSGKHIILGGSWAMSCQVYGLPVLHRLAAGNFFDNDLGFRCACNP